MSKGSLALKQVNCFIRNKIPISAQAFNERFGCRSDFYRQAKLQLGNLFTKVQFDPIAESNFDNWTRIFENVYGYRPDVSLFIDHVYLIILAKCFLYTKHRYVEPSEAEITEILNGRFFQNRGIKNFSEDFSGWLLIPKINRAVFNLFQELSSDLLDYDFSQI
ncbi:MAG: hypothetical protein ONB33_08310, partial [candidate division KSB1 bacterium]|nr:hypothetical protein [candidate division KSB1 bacterium]